MESITRTAEAVEKLVKFLNDSKNEKNVASDSVSNLFGGSNDRTNLSIDLEIAFLRAPVAHRVPLYFVVPNGITWGSICLVTQPPVASYKKKVLHLSEEGDAVAKRVKRVMDIKELNNQLTDPVTIRAFSKAYDNYVLYNIRKYPKALTGEFLGHQNLPVWVPKKGTFSDSLSQSARTVAVPRRGQNAITFRVGFSGMSVEQIIENITVFLDKFTRHPRAVSLDDILHIRVCGTDSNGKRAKLPIYGKKFDFTSKRVNNNSDENPAPYKRNKVNA